MPIPGNLRTTAMAVMPHKEVDRALEVALSLDVPFWPQLPHVSYYEDMYVQASENFPGILLDTENRTLRFSHDKFMAEFEAALARMEDPAYLDISTRYSVVYHRFLELDLGQKAAIRGQLEGPVSLGFNVLDEQGRPILFDDTVRAFLLEFMAKRASVQLQRLKGHNPNAFMFIDEPGLQFLFSAMSGYNNVAAKKDMENFFSLIDRPRGSVVQMTNRAFLKLLGLRQSQVLGQSTHRLTTLLEGRGDDASTIVELLSSGVVETQGRAVRLETPAPRGKNRKSRERLANRVGKRSQQHSL